MNVSDSERIAGFLELHKLKPAKNIDEADLVIFNTCGVRQMAEDRVYGQIHNLKAKSQKLKAKIILTGCLANRKDAQRRLKGKVDIFVSINKFFSLKIPSDINCGRNPYQTSDYFKKKPKYSSNFSALVPIMTGCNNFCSYCVVPYARGREFSRPVNEVLEEIKKLIKHGYKEIILLGQNVNSYKSKTIKLKTINFSGLLKMINAIPGNFWISFISNHPKDVTDEMIEAAAKCKKVCECFHLPLQAGNDEIIRKMNRKYTAKQYLNLVKKIKSAYNKYKPDMPFAITSDIIVGFPEETRKQFLDSAEVMRKVGYDMVFFGQYSPRPGTAAWNMKDNISKKEKERREKYLNEILKKTALENNKKYVGTVQEILVDRCAVNHSRELLTNKKGVGIIYFGKTRTMKNVKFSLLTPTLSSDRRNGYLVGKFVKVKITKANIWNLEAAL